MKVKNLMRIATISIMVLVLFTSCKNNDAIIDLSDKTTKSAAAKKSMEVLKTHFNEDGTVNSDNNPVGNILFDFCFEFVYPVTLSYSNGTEVVVENFEELIEVLVNMTNELFIDGIAFPFDVEVVENGAIVIRTISSEDEFSVLIESCIIEDDGCICTEEYNPVCVEIQTPNGGESFTMQFPNMCFAECEGFTQNDVVECDNGNPSGGNFFAECFDLVFPFSIVIDSGDVIEINNEGEFDTTLFTTSTFDFVYPIDVIQEINGQVETITLENVDGLISLLDSCNVNTNCNCPTTVDKVCVETPNGGTVEYQNACFALCDGYTPNNFVDCN